MRITEWLAVGERGISSEAIALTALGERPTGCRASWPRDPSDLRRCLLLLDASPEARDDGLLILAERCPEWAALVNVWDRLSTTLRSEIGETLPPLGSAPKTYALMLEAFDLSSRESDLKAGVR